MAGSSFPIHGLGEIPRHLGLSDSLHPTLILFLIHWSSLLVTEIGVLISHILPANSQRRVNRACSGMYLADRAGFQIASTMSALYDVVPLEGYSRPKPEMAEYSDTLIKFVFFSC